jgi:acetolactate synthase-1/2/3 large subunit
MAHGGKVLIDQLARLGVPRVFLVPGESFLAALDALYDEPSIETIVCRHEASCTMMAEATAKLTGRPGVAFVSRGPGAANAVPGLLIAQEDEVPVVLVVGLPSRRLDGLESFQHLETETFFAGSVKATLIAREPEQIPEFTVRAFHIASSGRPGPVVLAFPEDVLTGPCEAALLPEPLVPTAGPSPDDLARLQDLLHTAERPLMIVGGPGWSADTADLVQNFALRFDLPVASAFRTQDYIDNRHRCYVGHTGFPFDAKLQAGIRAADVVIALGARLGDFSTRGFTTIEAPEPKQHLVRIHPSAEAMLAPPRARTAIVAHARALAEGLTRLEPIPNPPWAAFRRDLRLAYEQHIKPQPTPGAAHMETIVSSLSGALPESAIITNGAGNYSQFVHRYFQYKRFRTSLAPGYGTMGYGLPAAIAAKLAVPAAPVVAFAGDGCFQMSMMELATAVQYGLPLVLIIADNGMFGTIRMHQERTYPGRVSGTTLANPDFAALARSLGAFGETVACDEDFAPAFARASSCGKAAVLHVRWDPEAINPAETIQSIRSSSSKRAQV